MSELRVPPHLLLLWLGTLFSRLAARPEKPATTAQEASTVIPIGWEGAVPVALSGSAHPCPWLLLHPCEHHTALLGHKAPFSKSQMVP